MTPRAQALQIAQGDGTVEPSVVVERAKAYLPFLEEQVGNAPPPANPQRVAPPKPVRTHIVGTAWHMVQNAPRR